MNKRILLMLLTALPIIAGQPSGFDMERLGRIPARLDGFVKTGRMAGVVTLVSRRGGPPVIYSAGWQDIEANKPMRSDAIFELMSMTKPVTALGIILLAEDGRLLLNDPVEKHLPQFRGLQVRDGSGGTLRKPSRLITILDLLTHTSGMAKVSPEGMHDIYFKLNRTLTEMVDVYAKQPLDFDPGTQWNYSNTGMATLGRIIEVLSGKPYELFLEERIFKPLGMKDTFIFPPSDKKARIAMVYRFAGDKLARGGEKVPGGDPTTYREGAKYSCPECGLYSTASDLNALYQMFLNGGSYQGKRIVSRAAIDLMTTRHTANLPKSWGLGWAITTDVSERMQFGSVGTYSHGGALGTHAWIDPRNGLLGIFLIQRSGGGPNEFQTFQSMVNTALID